MIIPEIFMKDIRNTGMINTYNKFFPASPFDNTCRIEKESVFIRHRAKYL